MWDGDRYTLFKCPVCGTDGYVRVRVKKPNGDWYRTEFFKCFSCSVMFTDPKEFTDRREIIRDPRPVGRGDGARPDPDKND